MGVYATLREHLADWAGDDTQRRAIAETITNLAKACVEVAHIVALGPLAGDMASNAATTPMETPRRSWISSVTKL